MEREADDVRAAEAVELFCYQARKLIRSSPRRWADWTTGVSGGIGENAPAVRARICQGLEFLGIESKKTERANAGVISPETSPVSVRIIHTDEERMIAKTVCRILGLPN